MSKIAIKGHPTRGNEVIELLEMMGGVNGKINKKTGKAYNICNGDYFIHEICDTREVAYYIDFESQIRCIDIKDITTNFIVYSLEMFLEKYPFKVGDKVNSPCKGCIKTITSMEWDTCRNTVTYKLDNRIYTNIDQLNVFNDLQPYKEETMEEGDKAMAPNLVGEDYYGKRFGYKIPNGYEFDCIKNNEIILKPKQPKYPSTYLECCSILQINNSFSLTYNNVDNKYITSYEYQLMLDMDKLRKLKVCRDAYWKIAGEEIGLNKSWEPDYTNPDIDLYVIINVHNNIEKAKYGFQNCVLSFPTEEMRDVFFENFKDLIECCKEYL